MNIFLSWSGHKSKQVAELLKTWLPQVIQAVKPWISSQDIDRGSLWMDDIKTSLGDSSFGIVCLTEENKNAPWILFESGALHKGLSSNRVCTFLIDLSPNDLLKNPLSNFNHTLNNKESIYKLLQTINSSLGERGLTEEILQKVFEKYYIDLEKGIDEIEKNKPIGKFVTKTRQEALLEEVLSTVRIIERNTRKKGTLSTAFGSPLLKSSGTLIDYSRILKVLEEVENFKARFKAKNGTDASAEQIQSYREEVENALITLD